MSKKNEPVAIIGIGCRFPGEANDPQSFWKLLTDGVDALEDIPADRWDLKTFYDPEAGVSGKTNVRYGGFVKNIDRFDADFFGISPREASRMDPQQRLLLETAWESLEDGGQQWEALAGSSTGVFVGISSYDFALIQAGSRDLHSVDVYTNTGGAMSIAANRISYCLDFKGPSVAVDTACSSSLTAVHYACQSINEGTCPLALAGGVNVIIGPGPYIGFSRLSMLSADGRCRAFDAKANGFVRAEGAGMVLLKPLSQAIADGDRIYATILSTAINQDGATSGLTVPSEESQRVLVREACEKAGVLPREIQFVESHGTGTLVGDPIEARALGSVLSEGRPRDNACWVGSVKTNIGHLEAGAGMPGLVKTALALKHRLIPANLHFDEPNPQIDFDHLGLRIPTSPTPWKSENGKAFAGINSFGFGGSNAHAILSGPPQEQADTHRAGENGSIVKAIAVHKNKAEKNGDAASPSHGPPVLMPLSARSADAVKALAGRYRQFVTDAQDEGGVSLGDLLYTLRFRRSHHDHRAAIVGHSIEELTQRLGKLAEGERDEFVTTDRVAPGVKKKLVFVCSGQGPQWWAMGRQLLDVEPIYRDMIEHCDELIRAAGADWSLLEELTREESSSRIDETSIAQPAIFATQVALAKVWQSWGIEPDAIIGHSVGEVAAAYLAGALSLEDAACTIYHRSRAMDMAAASGRMLAAALSVDEARAIIAPYDGLVEIAATNAPRSLTLSGQAGPLEAIAANLKSRKVFAKFLRVAYAFHSHHVESAHDDVLESLAHIQPTKASLPLISTVTGDWCDGTNLDAHYWWRNIRYSVHFAAGVAKLLENEHNVFLEISSHPVLTSSVAECAMDSGKKVKVFGSLRRQEEEQASLLRSLGQLYSVGISVDWDAQSGGQGEFITLPTYPWQRESHWHESEDSKQARLGLKGQHPLLGRKLNQATPTWEGFHHAGAQPWLSDHKVQGRVIVPGTAFLEMGVAAAAQHFGAGTYELEDVRLLKACFLNAKQSRVPQLTLDDQTGRFSISTRLHEPDQPWVQHATGVLRCRLDDAPECDFSPEALQQRCPDEVAGGDCYLLFEKIELQYGPTFRGIQRMWLGDREALGRIEVPEMLRDDLVNYQFHPAVWDACIQVLLGTIPKSRFADDAIQGVYLPVEMENVRVYGPPTEALWSHARLTDINRQGLTADIDVYDAEGNLLLVVHGLQCQHVGIEGQAEMIDDLLYASQWKLKARDQQPREQGGLLPPLSEIATDLEANVEKFVAQAQMDRYQGLETEVNRLCSAYVVKALGKLGTTLEPGMRFTIGSLVRELGIVPLHRRVFDRYLTMLAEDGILARAPDDNRHDDNSHDDNSHDDNSHDDVPRGEDIEWVVVARPSSEEPQRIWVNLLTANPAFFAELTMIRRCGESLDGVLRGEINPLQLIFPDGSLDTAEHLYQDSPSVSFYNLLAQQAIMRALADLPHDRPLRVLEIGAGTGGLTSYVVPRLPAERTQYVFTDLSNQFFVKGKQKFSPFRFIEYKLLDISKDPVEQGFDAHSFDVIIASQVLHATADLTETLTNARRLLAEDGLMVLLEVVQPARWIDVVFGLTEGWWYFSDYDIRPDYPLLTFPAWKSLLEDLGFTETVDVSATRRMEGFGSAVILSRGPVVVEEIETTVVDADAADGGGEEEITDDQVAHETESTEPTDDATESPEPIAGTHWLLFADRGGVAGRLAEKLTENGVRPVLVYPGEAFGRDEDGRYAIAADVKDDFKRLLAELKSAGHVPTGIVHLWNLDAPANEDLDTESLEAFQRYGCASVVHFVQAWDRVVKEPSKLWLVTRGAVSTTTDTSKLEAVSLAQTPMWGFGRVLFNEYPTLKSVSIDLGGVTADRTAGNSVEIDSLFAEFTANDGEEEVALRGKARYVHRYARASVEKSGAKNGNADSADKSFRLEVPQFGVLDRLRLRAFDRQEPGPLQIEIQVVASALNFSDVMKSLGLYPGLPDGPVPIGIECAGIVTAVGPGVEDLAIGDEVMALAPFSLGSHTITYAGLATPKPQRMTFEEATTLPIAFLTAQYALNHLARLAPGERILIHSAAGGVGLAAIQIARQVGAEIFATAGSSDRRDYLRSLGIEHVMDSRSLGFAEKVMEITGGEGVDVVLNSLSGDAIGKSLSLLGDYGRFLEIGKRDIYMNRALGMRPFKKNVTFFAIDLDRALRNRPKLIASQFQEVMGAVHQGKLHPLPHRVFSINNVVAAFRYMSQAKHLGKVVISLREPPLKVSSTVSGTAKMREDATYCISGGLGGFGLALAEWMIGQGAQHLVLFSRRGISNEETRQAVEDLRKTGAEVRVAAADVSDPVAMAEILKDIKETMPPLRGVMHAAMHLEDCLMNNLDHEAMMRVIRPKASGAWNLHSQTLGMPLDFFVCFSSMSSLFGLPGQANYAAGSSFLDHFAYYRRSLGLPALTVNWGYLRDVGYVARQENLGERFESQGLRSFSPREALALLGKLIEHDAVHVGVTRIDWGRWRSMGLGSSVSPRFAELCDEQAASENGSKEGMALRKALMAAPEDQRKDILLDFLREKVAAVLGASPEKIDLDKPLTDVGVDSLMAVELRNWIEGELRVNLPIVELMEGPSVDRLADVLLTQLTKGDAAPAKPGAMPTPEELKALASGGATPQSASANGSTNGSVASHNGANGAAMPTNAAAAEELLAKVPEMSDEDVDALLDTMIEEKG